MQLYHASLTPGILKRYYEIFGPALNVLLSMAYNQQYFHEFLIKCRHMFKRLIADSGAWSVAHKTSDMTIEALIAHLQMWEHMYDLYFNFDTDFSTGGFENNLANQLRMEAAGLKPVPVIHNFFDQEISYYVNSGKYDWLALGSDQSTNFDNVKFAVDRIKKGNPDIRIHLFGGSKFDWMVRLPIASCDTTSWAKTGSFGHILYWNDNYEGLYKMNKIYISGRIKEDPGYERKRQFHFVEYPWRRELEEYISKTFGLTYRDLCGYLDKENMQLVNIHYFTELERRINEERIKRGVLLE